MPSPLLATRSSVLLGCLFSISLFVLGCSSSSTDGTTGPDSQGKTHVANRPVQQEVTDAKLVKTLDDVLDSTRRRNLSARDHNAWQIVHGILAFSHDLQLEADGKVVPALDWILAGGSIKGWNMMPGEKGLEAILEPGTKSGQGHEDQWLGYLSQCEVDPETPLVINGMKFKVGDLVTQAQWDLHDGMEATWTLMALSTYLPLDARWKAKDGSEWTLERIVRMEASQDIYAGACGGTHRLYGLSAALNRYKNSGGQLTGGWLKAQEVIDKAIVDAKKYQQPDGGFSTNYLARSANSPDIGLRLGSSGHVLEFLTLALNDKQLQEPWVTDAVVYMCDLLDETKDQPLECGALYHAAHGLKLYRFRRFGDAPAAKADSADATKVDGADVIKAESAK
jgi:hypothetical protein